MKTRNTSKKLFASLSVVLIIAIAIVTLSASSVEQADSKNNSAVLIDTTIKAIKTDIPLEIFGGMHIDENGLVVINILENEQSKAYQFKSEINGCAVKYVFVDYSLEYLTSVIDILVEYMPEYHIATLDANDVTNAIDVEMYDFEYKTEVEELLARYITKDHINISLLPEEISFQMTIAYLDDADNMSDLGVLYNQFVTSNADSSLPIYPGMRIYKEGGVAATAGPKISSSKFRTAGHTAYQVFNPDFFILSGGFYYEIGSQSSIVFGANGDRLDVSVSQNSRYQLPSSNRFITGNGTYTLSSNYSVGMTVEMYGSFSGISAGVIQAVDQTVYSDEFDRTIGNLVKASYTCMLGDSGGGVFSPDPMNTNSYCYGTQSMGVFLANSDISLYSYFSGN